MLALVSLFLATLLIALTTIWLYRSLAGWQGFRRDVSASSSKDSGVGFKPGSQKGFTSLFVSSREMVRNKTLRSPKNGIKAPWGW